MFDLRKLSQVRGAIAPPGTHRCRLRSVEEVPGDFGKPAFSWVFVVEGGDHKGKEVPKTTGTIVRVGTSLGDLVGGLLGRKLQPGDDVSGVADCIGRLFEVVVTPRGTDGVEIASINPIKE